MRLGFNIFLVRARFWLGRLRGCLLAMAWIFAASLTSCDEKKVQKPAAPVREWKKGNLATRVVDVVDGDTVKCTLDGGTWSVRLDGIDAPERGQAHWKESRAELASLTHDREIVLTVKGSDRYGRGIARIYDSEGTYDLCQEMVRRGMAWHYRQYSKDPSLAKAELAAQSAQAGLWQEAKPTAPWDWRKRKKLPPSSGGRLSLVIWVALAALVLLAGRKIYRIFRRIFGSGSR